MPILDRYVVREVARPLLVVAALLVAVFAGWSAASWLGRAAEGLLRADSVALLIGLKTLIALEVLIPLALYFTVVIGLGRLYADEEMTAMLASGLSPRRIQGRLLVLFALVAVFVGWLSVWVRPWAYETSYELRARAEVVFDVKDLVAGRFYEDGEGERVVYVEDVEPRNEVLKGIFVWVDRGGTSLLARAEEAVRTVEAGTGRPTLEVHGLRVYRFEEERASLAVRADSLVIGVLDAIAPIGYKRKAAATAHLLRSRRPEDVAEVQWRLTRPLSALLLGFLALRLSRRVPAGERYGRIVPAVLWYAGYYLVSVMAKNQVEDGLVGPVPGLWWVEALLALLLLCGFPRPAWKRRRLW